MFHRITPKVRGMEGLYRGAYGTLQMSAPGSLIPLQVSMGLGVSATSQVVIQANNNGVSTCEIVSASKTAGDAQFRGVCFGVGNWAWGNRRSDGTFNIAPATNLLNPVLNIATTGATTINGPDSTSVPSLALNAPSSATKGTFLQIGISGGASIGWLGHGSSVDTGVITDLWLAVANNSGNLIFATGTSPAARMQIANGGNVTINAPTGGSPLTIKANDNTNVIVVNDTSTLTDGVTGLIIQHGGTNKGWIGTGIATGGSGTALNDYGLVASGGELFAGQNGSSTAVGCIPITYWIRNNSNLTLTSQTAAQKAFNGSTNGALNLPIGQYEFECFMPLSGMSATSGSFGFALGGTATILPVWWSIASKLGTAAATPEAVQWTYNLQSLANTTLATASTATTGFMLCRGFFTVSAAGTVIPQISLGVAAAATVAAGAYFFCRYQSISGARTGPNFGPWT